MSANEPLLDISKQSKADADEPVADADEVEILDDEDLQRLFARTEVVAEEVELDEMLDTDLLEAAKELGYRDELCS